MKRQFHTPTCRVYVRNYYVNTQPTNREGHVGPSYSDTRGVTLFLPDICSLKYELYVNSTIVMISLLSIFVFWAFRFGQLSGGLIKLVGSGRHIYLF